MSPFMMLAIAWRNLWRQRRRTVLTLVSIAFGGFLAVLVTAMEDRSFSDFIDNAARLGAGHVAMQHPDYRDTPTLTRSVTGSDQKRTLADADPAVTTAVERVSGQAMVSTAADSFGALFIAYDPTLETPDTFAFTKGLVKGALFEKPDDKGVLLGATLAKNLGAELGSKIVYTLTDRHGEIATGMERVRGLIETGAPSLDGALVLLPIGTLRAQVGYDPHESTQVAVFLKDGRQAPATAARLGKEVGAGVSVLTWDEIQPEIRSFVAMKVGGSQVLELIIALLIAAGIFNTIFMSVLERTREFGIMLALGYTARQLFSIVMAESALLATMGLLVSSAITAWPYFYLVQHGIDMTEAYRKQGLTNLEVSGVTFSPILKIGIFPENALFIAGAIVGATLLAGIYPAWRAGRVDPVESINLV